MRIKLQALTEHIHGFLLILGITAFLSCLIFPSHYLFYFFHSFLLLIPFAVTAYGQEKIKHFVSYFIIGIACAILLFFIGSNFWEKLYFLILSVAIMLIRIPSRLQKTDDYEIVDENVIESGGLFDSPSAGFLGYFVLLFFIALLLKRNDLQTILYWITFAWLTDFLIYTNLKSLNRYLYSRRNIANLPGKQIISTNRALMIAFSILALVVMLVVPLLPLDHIVYSIGIAIRDFLRWIFSHFSSEEQTVVETAAESLATSGQSAMFAAILFVVSAGALVGIGYTILMLVHRFYKPSAVTGDIQEFINEETESTFLQDSEKKERDSLFSMLFNPNTTIRKKFKKQIQQGSHLNKKAGNSIPVSLTPLELEQYAKLPDDERTHLLHALYEKARYSKEGCTKDDVASFKKS